MLGTNYRIKLRFTTLKIRSFVYVILVVLGIVGTGLLCVDAFVKQGFRSTQESVSTIILLSSQVVSTTCVPVIILLGSSDSIKDSRWFNHAWFELLCLGLILGYQFAGALLFSVLSSSFPCSGNANEQGTCQLVNVYISICSWVSPLILLFYYAYIMARCLLLSAQHPKVWGTPFTLIPWNSDLLDFDFESKPSTSTLNKPRSGSLDEINQPIAKSSTSTGSPSVRGSTQSQNPASISRFSSSGPSVRGSTQTSSITTPNLSRFSQVPPSARSSTQSQPPLRSGHPLQLQTAAAMKNQQSSNPAPSSKNLEWRQSQERTKHRQSQGGAASTLGLGDRRLTFQQTLLPPNPPPMVHAKLGPPIPLTLPTLQDKRIPPYIPYSHRPPAMRQSTIFSTQLSMAGSASRTSVAHPPSLYPSRNSSRVSGGVSYPISASYYVTTRK